MRQYIHKNLGYIVEETYPDGTYEEEYDIRESRYYKVKYRETEKYGKLEVKGTELWFPKEMIEDSQEWKIYD